MLLPHIALLVLLLVHDEGGLGHAGRAAGVLAAGGLVGLVQRGGCDALTALLLLVLVACVEVMG